MNVQDPSSKVVKSWADVRAYLVHEYVVDTVRAEQLCKDPSAKELIDSAIRCCSFAYYPGDQIAEAAGLVAKDTEGDDE